MTVVVALCSEERLKLIFRVSAGKKIEAQFEKNTSFEQTNGLYMCERI
jgi:hypothetical protein